MDNKKPIKRKFFFVLPLLLLTITLFGCGGGSLVTEDLTRKVTTLKVTGPGNGKANGKTPQTTDPVQDPVQEPSERSVKLHNYNNWGFNNTQGWTNQQMIEVLSRKDNVSIQAYWDNKVSPSALRTYNPNIKVYFHWNLIGKSIYDVDGGQMSLPVTDAAANANGWWLLDSAGNKIANCESNYYMNVGKAGFKEAWLSGALAYLAGKGYDGVVLDYWHPNIYTDTGGKCADYTSDAQWYTTAWQPFITYITNGLRSAGYRIIGNCAGEYTQYGVYAWQRSTVDGTVYEQGSVEWRGLGGGWLSGSTIANRIYSLQNDPLELWFSNNGIRPDTADYQQKIAVSLAVYYIGIPADQSNRSYNYPGDWGVFWDTLWDFKIGTPTGAAFRPTSAYFWYRQYTNGIVLLNYDPTPRAHSLSGAYVDSNGTSYSGTITIPAYTALILKTQ